MHMRVGILRPLLERLSRHTDSQAIPFTRWRFWGFATSAALLVAMIAVLATQGLNLSSDFSGGTVVEARSLVAWDLGELRADLAREGVTDARVLTLGDPSLVAIRTGRSEADLPEAIGRALGPQAEILDASTIGPKVSAELLRSGLMSCGLAVVAIGLYIWLRFDSRFALSAFLTTFHDAAMMIGYFAFTRLPFDLTSVAAVLLIAGYSINDTVVVFDRLRETLGKHRDWPLDRTIDEAITSTLRRTLMTSGTTLMTSVSLAIFGGPVLFGFASSVSFGILLGTLSSIFVAAPLLLHLPGGLPGRADRETPQDPLPPAA